MFHRRDVGVLRGNRARHGDQGLTGRVGDQMKMKVVARRGHPVRPVNPCEAR